MASFKGTNKAETLRGSALADKIQALGGDDIIYGLGGNDTIEAGGGDDRIDAGAGSDTIDGGVGSDTLDYSSWSGRIRVTPAWSSPTAQGSGTAEEYGATGALLSSDKFSYIENVIATAGNDLVSMGGDNNSVWGGAGDDYLIGGSGDDKVYGGTGNDLIDGGPGIDAVDGGDGIDTLFWSGNSPFYLTVDLQAGTITYPGDPTVDTVTGMENVRGYAGNKQIYGDDGRNIIEGGYGSDVIAGRGGDDLLVGDLGRPDTVGAYTFRFADRIDGGAGNDVLSGDLESDVLTGGSGADTFVIDTYYGTDRITDFQDGVDTLALYGGLTINGWEGRDTNGDGVSDAQAALLSNGQALIFDGYTAAPSSLASGSGLALHAEQFAIPDLANWSADTGWGGIGL
jgi:Ca2+-binding RTX toxin-like protein